MSDGLRRRLGGVGPTSMLGKGVAAGSVLDLISMAKRMLVGTSYDRGEELRF